MSLVNKPVPHPEIKMTEDTKSVSNRAESVQSPYEAGVTAVDVTGPNIVTTSDDAADIQLVHRGNVGKWLLFNIGLPIVLLAAAAGLVIFLGAVQPSTRPSADNTRAGRLRGLPAVDILPVQSLADSGKKLNLNTDGTVVPYREVVLATEVAGRIIDKSPQCEAGQYVTEGTVLMRIDPTDYELTVQRLEQSKQSDYEAIGEVDQQMINIKRSLEITDAEIALQNREVKRLANLPADFAAGRDVDAAKRAVLQAEQQKVSFQNQIDLLKKQRSRLEIAEQLAATQLQQARIDLQRTEIRAPIDGVIASEQAELNTFVSRGSPVVTMEDTSKVEVATSLRTDQLYWVLNQTTPDSPLDELNAPANGAHRGYRLPPTSVKVLYQLSGREDVTYVWQGELIGYDGIGLDEQTRTVPVRVVVDQPQLFQIQRMNDDGTLSDVQTENRVSAGPTALVRGMFVRLRLELQPAVPLMILPAEALKPGNRVWEFIPDESVLDAIEAAPSTENVADANEPESAMEAADDSGDAVIEEDREAVFEPEKWVAGRLVIRHNVRPVDQLPTSNASNGQWICEVPSETISSDSYIVVSPLGSIEADTFPVRAPVDMLKESEATESIASK